MYCDLSSQYRPRWLVTPDLRLTEPPDTLLGYSIRTIFESDITKEETLLTTLCEGFLCSSTGDNLLRDAVEHIEWSA